jgi:demethylmenaquinone methyltransferase/2-methoxy-6-polyprenyl-1,4-benzoquinol methylase
VRVDAVDVAKEMLSLAADKMKRLDLREIYLHEASALALPFQDKTFDAVMMGFGLRNLRDIPAGLAEMLRVLKPGGIFTTLDLGKPRGLWRRGLYRIYFETLMPWLGKQLFHRNEFNSFAYLSTSNKYFPDSETIMAHMRDVGFTGVHDRVYMFGGVAQQVGIKG